MKKICLKHSYRMLIFLKHTWNLHMKFTYTKPQSRNSKVIGQIPEEQNLRDGFI